MNSFAVLSFRGNSLAYVSRKSELRMLLEDVEQET